MSKQTVKGSAFGGIDRTSGESEESTSQGLSTDLPPSAKKLEEFPIDQIFLGSNVRKSYSNLEDLADSIEQNGLLEPIGIEKEADPKTGKRKLVYGHRRFKAVTEILKWKSVRVILVDSKFTKSDEQRSIIQLIENIQREDISDSDLALTLNEIKTRLNLTNKELSKRLSKSESWTKAKIDHASLISQGLSTDLSTSFANETKGLPENERIQLLKSAKEKGLTQKELRDKVNEHRTKNQTRTPSKTSLNQSSKVSKGKLTIDPKVRIRELKSEIKTLETELKQKRKELQKLVSKSK